MKKDMKKIEKNRKMKKFTKIVFFNFQKFRELPKQFFFTWKKNFTLPKQFIETFQKCVNGEF